MMDWWEKAVLPPVKRALVAVAAAARVKPGRKAGGERGIEKLEDDIQTCGYEDVQVMWEMLRTEKEIKSKHPPISKAFVWFDRPAPPPHRRHRLSEVHAQIPSDDRRSAARFHRPVLCADRCLPK